MNEGTHATRRVRTRNRNRKNESVGDGQRNATKPTTGIPKEKNYVDSHIALRLSELGHLSHQAQPGFRVMGIKLANKKWVWVGFSLCSLSHQRAVMPERFH